MAGQSSGVLNKIADGNFQNCRKIGRFDMELPNKQCFFFNYAQPLPTKVGIMAFGLRIFTSLYSTSALVAI